MKRFFWCTYPVEPEIRGWLHEELDRWIKNGFKNELRQDTFRRLRFTSAAFIHHGARKKRIVVDLCPLNKQCSELSPKMEGLRIFPSFIHKEDLLIAWEWQDGYHHFCIHSPNRQLFRF